MIAPPAAGAPILSASFFFVAGAVRPTARGLDRVALVVAARRQRVEPHRDVRASLHLARARRVGHDAADARAFRRAPSAPCDDDRRARGARATGSSTRLMSEPTAVSSTIGSCVPAGIVTSRHAAAAASARGRARRLGAPPSRRGAPARRCAATGRAERVAGVQPRLPQPATTTLDQHVARMSIRIPPPTAGSCKDRRQLLRSSKFSNRSACIGRARRPECKNDMVEVLSDDDHSWRTPTPSTNRAEGRRRARPDRRRRRGRARRAGTARQELGLHRRIGGRRRRGAREGHVVPSGDRHHRPGDAAAWTGSSCCARCSRQGADVTTLLLTAQGTVETAVEAMKEGAYDYLTKPVDIQRLKILLDKIVERQETLREVKALRRQLREHGTFGSMIGNSPRDAEDLPGRSSRRRRPARRCSSPASRAPARSSSRRRSIS